MSATFYDTSLGAALRRGLPAGGVLGEDMFPTLEMCPSHKTILGHLGTRWICCRRATAEDTLGA